MNKKDFLQNIEKVYEYTKQRNNEINSMYLLLKKEDGKNSKILEKMALTCEIELTKQNKIVLLSRIVNLREDPLIQILEDLGNSKKIIDKKMAKIYKIVSTFYIKEHTLLLKKIEKENLLTPFYITLLKGVHEIGKKLTIWQPKWTKHILQKINPTLLNEFKSNEKIMQYLNSNNLLDINPDGSTSDRSYSVLVKKGKKYKNVSYSTFFKNEVENVVNEIEKLIINLKDKNDEIFDAKDVYVNYLEALKTALKEEDTRNLIYVWQNVDRAWMQIKTPFQIGHPLEYYEDHYKKAVAIEWDVRFSNPKKTNIDKTKENITNMYKKTFLHVNGKLNNIYEKSLQNIQKTQVYIGQPFIYYAAQFNGLFSAQVVPNDEFVSHELGKKIFAYSQNVLESIKAKPFMKLSNEIFDKEFLKKERELIFKKNETWHKIYEITTIGHEFGHILWMDDNTETLMNKSGSFKNIEEFKATAGGLVAFFENIDKELLEYVIQDTIKRAIGLISWMKSREVEPYYCEGLIHLSGLFESGVLEFGKKVKINTDKKSIDALISWYIDVYKKLAKHYIYKSDAKEFLDFFAIKEDGFFMPKDKTVHRFVSYYWELYRTIGREIDESDKKENYM